MHWKKRLGNGRLNGLAHHLHSVGLNLDIPSMFKQPRALYY